MEKNGAVETYKALIALALEQGNDRLACQLNLSMAEDTGCSYF